MLRLTKLSALAAFAVVGAATAHTAAAVVAAGGAISTEEVPTETDPVATYAAQVEQALVRFDVTGAEVASVLEGSYTDRAAFIAALAEAVSGDTVAPTLADLRDIDPPAEFVDDHEALVTAFDSILTRSETLENALEEGDLLGVMLEIVEIRLTLARLTLTVSPEICGSVSTDADTGLCVDPTSLPGGEYGVQANAIASRVHVEVFTRITTVGFPTVEPEEEFEFLAVIQPDVELTLAATAADLAQLDPPTDLAADHDAALTYLNDFGEIAAGVTAAAEARDEDELERLYDLSGEPGEALRNALSEDGAAIFRAIS